MSLKNKSFTLVEPLMVLGIIVLLAALMFPYLSQWINGAIIGKNIQ